MSNKLPRKISLKQKKCYQTMFNEVPGIAAELKTASHSVLIHVHLDHEPKPRKLMHSVH